MLELSTAEIRNDRKGPGRYIQDLDERKRLWDIREAAKTPKQAKNGKRSELTPHEAWKEDAHVQGQQEGGIARVKTCQRHSRTRLCWRLARSAPRSLAMQPQNNACGSALDNGQWPDCTSSKPSFWSGWLAWTRWKQVLHRTLQVSRTLNLVGVVRRAEWS